MAGQVNGKEDSYLKNLFILFYTLRYLWKYKERKVDDLYKKLFPTSRSKDGNKTLAGNKTLYDNILRLKDCNMLPRAKHLSEIIGISEKYFTGETKLTTHVSDENWEKYIRLRKKRGSGPKDAELVSVENEIKRGIKLTADNPSSQSEPFKRLLYFAEFGSKHEDKGAEDLFREIESKIEKCYPSDLEQVQLETLEKHQRAIQEYLRHIAAVAILKRWRGV